ncbi:Holliday junction-specific endonuclease [Williamsoniiplasma somnilux]|uniref:Holliday junction resolvase RecU n=1 Tax=Williamsoniiplasma somnilux TaxID=215578 RepID=A0A2K8NZ52_9MOLU|nr:Holliday junction resolvase RecU [Williamsoniiplasma somnilux]ATZ18836.1 Holliday junction-specific endonuclease [Williamsoniiplasma somnilux]
MKPINNQGMFLEEILNITHNKYEQQEICSVSKIPTNIGVVKTNHNKLINSALFKESSNCDYIGNFIGRYFEFEAKETYQDFFNWQGIRKNQIKKLNHILATNGLAFLIIYFGQFDKYFLIDFALLQFRVNNFGQKVYFQWFEKNAHELFLTHELKLDYLQCFNSLTNWI